MTNTYAELIDRQQAETDAFPEFGTFTQKQFNEGMRNFIIYPKGIDKTLSTSGMDTCCKNEDKKKTPFLKWAGGKTQILTALQERMPDNYNNYYEPFVGGGALLLAVSPYKAIINDKNEQLINVYRQLKNSYIDVLKIINAYDSVSCDKNFYREMRKKYNEKIKSHELDAECAALFICINKRAYNGLYRVNSQGLFNVSYNNRTTWKSVDEDNLKAVGEYLKKNDIKILSQDFEEVCDSVSSGDFLYFDPLMFRKVIRQILPVIQKKAFRWKTTNV